MMQVISNQKWYIKCTLLIDNQFSITNVAMIDSGADVSCIQEGLFLQNIFKKQQELGR
ncbi:MAG: hypothetical protein Q8834_02815 [Candidatus Phytoplasma australasiaticum]|nr:hypothetical protein [Candidatus Phytoplasma australasiaticum]